MLETVGAFGILGIVILLIMLFVVWMLFPFIMRANLIKLQKQLGQLDENVLKLLAATLSADKHRREELEALADFCNSKAEEQQ